MWLTRACDVVHENMYISYRYMRKFFNAASRLFTAGCKLFVFMIFTFEGLHDDILLAVAIRTGPYE